MILFRDSAPPTRVSFNGAYWRPPMSACKARAGRRRCAVELLAWGRDGWSTAWTAPWPPPPLTDRLDGDPRRLWRPQKRDCPGGRRRGQRRSARPLAGRERLAHHLGRHHLSSPCGGQSQRRRRSGVGGHRPRPGRGEPAAARSPRPEGLHRPPILGTVTEKGTGGANMGTTTSAYATCAGFEIHYLTWGDPPPPVILWHGLPAPATTSRRWPPLWPKITG